MHITNRLNLCRYAWSALMMLGIAASAVASEPSEGHELAVSATPGGVEFAMWGGPENQAAPKLVIMPGKGLDQLSDPSVLKAGVLLVPRGYRCVGIDLPDHGKQASREVTGVHAWAQRCIEGDNFVAEFNERMKQVVDHLIAEGLTDPERIVAAGTSRGGFLAIHYAAFDPRVAGVVAYAPATDLSVVHKYFDVARDAPMVDQLSVFHQAPNLVGRPMLIFVGDRDDGVATDTAIRFARELSAAAVEADVPSGVELHVISEPRGHALSSKRVTLPAARWIYRLIDRKELIDL